MKKYVIVRKLNVLQTEIIHVKNHKLKTINFGGPYTSIGIGYDTLEQLKKDRNIPDFKCSFCGGVIDAGYSNKEELLNHKMCFNCNFWREVKTIVEKDKNRVIINNSSYQITPDGSSKTLGFRGFGGSLFKIKRFDDPDTIIATHNLWHQGAIPKEWQKLIPDNAKFVS